MRGEGHFLPIGVHSEAHGRVMAAKKAFRTAQLGLRAERRTEGRAEGEEKRRNIMLYMGRKYEQNYARRT